MAIGTAPAAARSSRGRARPGALIYRNGSAPFLHPVYRNALAAFLHVYRNGSAPFLHPVYRNGSAPFLHS